MNGVEYHSPISNESVYYGQIDELQVTNSGENFDVINPPTLAITDQNGINCESNMNCNSLIDRDQLADNHTFVDHKNAHCRSNEMYKGIYLDKSKGVFNLSLIHI